MKPIKKKKINIPVCLWCVCLKDVLVSKTVALNVILQIIDPDVDINVVNVQCYTSTIIWKQVCSSKCVQFI